MISGQKKNFPDFRHNFLVRSKKWNVKNVSKKGPFLALPGRFNLRENWNYFCKNRQMCSSTCLTYSMFLIFAILGLAFFLGEFQKNFWRCCVGSKTTKISWFCWFFDFSQRWFYVKKWAWHSFIVFKLLISDQNNIITPQTFQKKMFGMSMTWLKIAQNHSKWGSKKLRFLCFWQRCISNWIDATELFFWGLGVLTRTT